MSCIHVDLDTRFFLFKIFLTFWYNVEKLRRESEICAINNTPYILRPRIFQVLDRPSCRNSVERANRTVKGDEMGYLTGNKEEEPLDMERFIDEIRNNAKRKGFYLNAIRTLLVFIKSFSVDQKEIDSDRFAKQMDDLSETFAEEKDAKSVQSIFERHKKIIPAFI